MPQLRKDPITRDWVIIATDRAKRPLDFGGEKATAANDDRLRCPFCPGNEEMTPPEVMAFRPQGSEPDRGGWWVRVVPNKFPALAIEGNLDKSGIGIYDTMNGVGAHEVIIETPDHSASLATMTYRQVEDLLWAYRARYLDLKKDPRFKYILIFRNHGRVAGASLAHPHSQLIATPMVPGEVADEIEGSRLYEQYRDRCVYCDILRQELSQGERIVAENAHFLAFEPFASRLPFETWLVPKIHASAFTAISNQEQASFAEMLRDTLRRIQLCLNDPPYNYTLHTSPCDEDDRGRFHWHLEIFPRLTIAAGFEMGTGIYINVTPPEQAAAFLREVSRDVESPVGVTLAGHP
jgi:UDPglucose--hexose-1-phosphate uridylyltransferase